MCSVCLLSPPDAAELEARGEPIPPFLKARPADDAATTPKDAGERERLAGLMEAAADVWRSGVPHPRPLFLPKGQDFALTLSLLVEIWGSDFRRAAALLRSAPADDLRPQDLNVVRPGAFTRPLPAPAGEPQEAVRVEVYERNNPPGDNFGIRLVIPDCEPFTDCGCWYVRENAEAEADRIRSALRAPVAPAEPDGFLRCHDCGLLYSDAGFCGLVVANDVWAAMSPTGHEGGLLCPTCMCRRAAMAGLDLPVRATFRSGPFADFSRDDATHGPGEHRGEGGSHAPEQCGLSQARATGAHSRPSDPTAAVGVAPAEPWTADERQRLTIRAASLAAHAVALESDGAYPGVVRTLRSTVKMLVELLARLAPAPAETQAVTDGEIDRLAGEG